MITAVDGLQTGHGTGWEVLQPYTSCVVSYEKKKRLQKYSELLPRFLEVKALAFSSDYDAIEAMNFFLDQGIKIPDQISITGYDDSIYAQMVRPKLTTVHQDVSQKAHLALSRLLRMAQANS